MRAFIWTIAIVSLSISGLTAQTDESAEEGCDAMFVQTATGMTHEGGELKLTGADPYLVYFCDRPVREAGHISWNAFIELGTQGENSFIENQPNAAISVFGEDGDEVLEAVVVLSKEPSMKGDVVTYTVEALDGDLPAMGGETVIFIDPLGVPVSPTSAAGVHRRHRRRAVARH
jgi:hypothetical protein